MKKNFYSEDGSKQEILRNLVLEIHKKIIKCGKCDEGYIKNQEGLMGFCKCCEAEMSQLQYNKSKDGSIEVVDPLYETYLRVKKDIYNRDSNGIIEFTASLCADCQSYFKTNIKGRARCEKCFKEYSKEFLECGKAFKNTKKIFHKTETEKIADRQMEHCDFSDMSL